MVYSTMIQTYICSGSHYTFIGGRPFSSQKKSATPPATISNSFLLQIIKNVLNCAIINKKQFVKLLIIKTNKYLSYISEYIIMIIGKCYMCALCLVYGVQLACIVWDMRTNKDEYTKRLSNNHTIKQHIIIITVT